MKKETINFVFDNSNNSNKVVAHSINTKQSQELNKQLVIEKLKELAQDYSNVSCKIKDRNSSSTFVFKFKNNDEEFLARVLISNNDPFYSEISTMSDLYEVKKKYNRLKIAAVTAGLVLVAANPTVQKHASNFVKTAIEYDNDKLQKEADMNKLNSLVMRLEFYGLTREEFTELRDLLVTYGDELQPSDKEKYEEIIEQNQGKII